MPLRRYAFRMPSYGVQLKIDDLLPLQKPASAGPAHDEMLFIVMAN